MTPRWIQTLPIWLPLVSLLAAVTVNYQPALGPVGAVLDAAIDLATAGTIAGAVWLMVGFKPRYRTLVAWIWVIGTLGMAAISWLSQQPWS
ncbi:MAG: hypothetical protein SF002_17240 [Alphaproteobacteria bacterium]|nr:hypothetical protein [Alphaproteobacteria bacterium]